MNHLQKVILDIMNDIDILCQKNNISYYLAYGTVLGAVRHKGFIPWDDDIDIILDSENYDKFMRIAKEQLDPAKYFVQEAIKDWPDAFSKIRLNGTKLEEHEGYYVNGNMGIYIDIFRMDNAPNAKWLQKWQYICGKYHLCYLTLKRGYKSASLKQKLLMYSALPLYIKPLRDFFVWQTQAWNKKDTDYLACYYTRYRFHGSIIKKAIYGNPVRIPFEDTELPVPEHYKDYLAYVYGDYMKLPPEEKRVGLHVISVDYGKY